jgi:ATP/maltotriose-dependent transcriptional regulator MalT
MTEPSAAPLLNTKLFVPRLRRDVVKRPHLVAHLNAGIQRPLTLVSAPAGFGKTTALAEWVDQLQMPVAWVSLDEDDNDPARFFTYFAAALQTVLPSTGGDALIAFRSPQLPPVESVMVALINEIAEAPNSFALVLDDYHVIKARPVHTALTFLIEHIPAQMHLVIATRSDPPLALARLRGRMQLVELRAADLRFTAEEVVTLLNQVMGLNLSDDDAAALEARTEGWIVGLQLAALSMKGRHDLPGFVAAFTGDHRFVLDYLADEVLSRQPEDVQTFLLNTSVLDRLCGPLCDAVLNEGGQIGEDDRPSQVMLEYLEQNNLFIMPLDDERHWYRYHNLFADLLRNRLDRSRASQVRTLHARASLWYERNGSFSEAVRHALDAGDWQRAADLVERGGGRLFDQGEMMTLEGWLARLPEEAVRSSPRLCLYYAWTHVIAGWPGAVESSLQDAERSLPLGSSAAESLEITGHIAAIRAYSACFQGDAPRAVALARQALQFLPEHDLLLRGLISHTLGLACLLTGDATGACQALAEAGRLGQAAGNIHLAVSAISHLGGEQSLLGRLHQAAETFGAALQLATGRDWRLLPIAATACFGLSELYYEWHDLETATRWAQESVELSRQWGDAEMLLRAPLALVRVLQARGDMNDAYDALESAEKVARRHDLSPGGMARVEACRIRLWLAPVGGNTAAAARWAEARDGVLRADGELPPVREMADMALARVLIAQGRHSDALAWLSRLRAAANAGGRLARVIEGLVLEAVVQQAMGELMQAVATLDEALSLAEPEGYVRTFVDEGTPVAALLSHLVGDRRSPRAAYVCRLLATFGIEVSDRGQVIRAADSRRVAEGCLLSPWVEPLSERELEVLRCIAAGLSNGEIAQQLVIAVSTVKRHINHIFGKLGVTTRTQALVRAKELGLL